MDNRLEVIRGLDLTGLRILEIGPLHQPLLSRDNVDVRYADYCSREELIEKYKNDPAVDKEAIVSVDYVTGGGSILEAIPAPKFDLIVASHVIEHVPDLIGWLGDLRSLLTDRGLLAFVIPDKRYTFDVHRRLTIYREIALAHQERWARPSLWSVIDYFTNVVRVNSAELWKDPNVANEAERCVLPSEVGHMIARWDKGEYIDVHTWVFTPVSFKDLFEQIRRESRLGLQIEFFQPTMPTDLQFFVRLRKC